MVQNDENRMVPPLIGENAELAIQDAAQARANAHTVQDAAQASTSAHTIQTDTNEDMDVDHAPVKMVIVDGMVTGPVVCAQFI
jgi:hypothetical protein